MEKLYARFLVPSDRENANIITNNRFYAYKALDKEQEKLVKEQMSNYLVNASNCYEYEYDDYDSGPSRSYSSKDVELENLISLTSPMYSSNEVCADIIVENGEFFGVIIKIRKWGGNGWSNYDESWYTILCYDGTIIGENTSCYCFSGSSSSKCDETTYTLIKK